MKTLATLKSLPRPLRWLGYLLTLLIVIALLSWQLLPGYVKQTLEQQVQEKTGRQLKIGEVAFNPLLLSLRLSNLTLFAPDNITPAFSADGLLINLSPTSLFHVAPVIRELVLTRPQLQLVRSQFGSQVVSNFSDVFARLAQHPSKGGAPLRFAVNNIQLQNGAVHLDDQITGGKIQIDALTVGLPFISNFNSATDIFVQPSLSAKVNGNLIDLKGQVKPFSDSHETSLAIDIEQLDLMPLMAFLPKTLPVALKSASFSSHLSWNFFSQKDAQHMTLTGTAGVSNLSMTELSGAPLLKIPAIRLKLRDVNLINDDVGLDLIEIDQPEIWLGLNQQGVLNWLGLQTNKSAAIAVNTAAAAKPAKIAKPVQPAPVAKTAAAQIEIGHLQVINGSVHWSDAAYATPALQMHLAGLNIDAKKISTVTNAAPASVNFSVGGSGKQSVKFVGKVDLGHSEVSGELHLADLALADYQPYVNRILAANLSGSLALHTKLALQNGKFSVNEFSGTLDKLKLQATTAAYGSWSADKIALLNLTMNAENKQARLEQLQLDHLQGDLLRAADGTFNFSHLIKVASSTTNASTIQLSNAANAKASSASPAIASKPWQAVIDKVTLTDSQLQFADASVTPAIQVTADNIGVQIDHVSSSFDQPMQVKLQARMNKSGQFSVQGSATPKALNLTVGMQNLSVATLQPYFTQFLNVTLASGTLTTNGNVSWNAPDALHYTGMLQLANFRSMDKASADDFLKWKLLAIDGITIDMNRQQQTITLAKIALNDFYTRAILSEKGKLNLRDVVIHAQPAVVANTMVSNVATDTAASVPALALAPPSAPAVVRVINIGQISLNNGTINYSDNFIKPHYTMRMTGMTGSVGAINSALAQVAPVSLRGQLDGDAPIAITGSMNPLFAPMMLDINMTATGVDLPHMTTYAAKYAGYPIEKGKLSLDVHYQIQDNKLTATNSLILDQLTFGDKGDSPDATHLPVPFLVSLLTDQDGKINLNLPISGTLNDPEFSLGGLIFKVLEDVLEKIILSPFSLFSHASDGSGDELSYIEFASGSSELSVDSLSKLDTLAKALVQHPKLILDMTGRADMQADDSGLRAYLLDRQIKRLLLDQHPDADPTAIAPAIRAKAIEQLYSAAKFVKPRNALGLAKSLPVADMEQLLLTNISFGEDNLRSLALARESAVRQYLTANAHIGADRMFSIAPKLDASDIKDKGAVTRVDFALEM